MEFSPKTYARLKARLKKRYHFSYQKVKKQLALYPGFRTSQFFKLYQSELSEYSPLRWFYLKQVESLIFFISQKSHSDENEEFTSAEDDIFEKWNQSEFADIFLKLLNQGISLRRASLETAKQFDLHLVALGKIHLLKLECVSKYYRPQISLGDVKRRGQVTRLLQTTLQLDGKEVTLHTSSIKEMKSFASQIETALRVIKQFSTDSWQRFEAFTNVIIPIKQEEFVSYSHQELPGTSMINLYHRDFVDLLDDLLHENGHHHLNYYLNLQPLIQETLECIYFSPWRRTLRPLRGIYHAYFTFFWAFKLFSDLAISSDLDSSSYVFNQQEKEKIIWRAVEEYWMLEFSFLDLKWAYKKGLISQEGFHLVSEQRKMIQRFKRKIPTWERSLLWHKADLKHLKKNLLYAKKHYKKD